MRYDVTIGIPMYNVEDFIERTMESALSQSYPNIEFLVVDDGSTDNSVCLVQKLIEIHPRGKDIKLVSLSQNYGPAHARNLIIEEAKGNYLYFMDADDVIKESTISLMMRWVHQDIADIVFGSMEKISLSGKITLYKYPEMHFSEENDFPIYAYRKYAGIQASACNILVNLSVIRKNELRFFDSNYWEDFVFVLDLVTYFSHAVLLPDITYTYCCRENSLSNFQVRNQIEKSEVFRNIGVVEYMKKGCQRLRTTPYYPQRCYIASMTYFYIACNILKNRKLIVPEMTNREIALLFSHPATFREICSFNKCRVRNIFLYILGNLPSSICVFVVWFLGKIKKLI